MGTKPSNNFQSDRPESGGADRDEQRENSGLLEREKQKFAAAEKNAEKEITRGGAQKPRRSTEGPPVESAEPSVGRSEEEQD